jgi:hypothetical protein
LCERGDRFGPGVGGQRGADARGHGGGEVVAAVLQHLDESVDGGPQVRRERVRVGEIGAGRERRPQPRPGLGGAQ